MASIKNGRVLFNEIPSGYPELGKTILYDESRPIELETIPLNGGTLLKTLAVSIDPYMRNLMNSTYQKGEPVFNYGVGEVLRNESLAVKVGDYVYGIMPFQDYNIFSDISKIPRFLVIKNEHKLPLSVYIGVAGMPGQTAWMGWKEYADPHKGDVVFVSAGGGAVGSLVIQIAKQEGLKVVACAGSDEKVQFIRELGADVAFNYKTSTVGDVLKDHGPINIYWDNVGGETLDAALDHAADGARFIECGMITGYNGSPPHVRNLFYTVQKEIRLQGFIVGTLIPKY